MKKAHLKAIKKQRVQAKKASKARRSGTWKTLSRTSSSKNAGESFGDVAGGDGSLSEDDNDADDEDLEDATRVDSAMTQSVSRNPLH